MMAKASAVGVGSVAHKYRLASTCKRMGSVTSGGKCARSHLRAGSFVIAVDALVGDVFRQSMDQMSDVMQQGSHHQRGRGLCLSGERGGLQRVLLLRNPFAEICIVSAGLE